MYNLFIGNVFQIFNDTSQAVAVSHYQQFVFRCQSGEDNTLPIRQNGTYIEKAEDDLTPKTRENITLEELMKTWMAKLNDNCIFISAREKINMDELKTIIYNKVRELHVQKYPYNDFLYQTYDEE